jgi:hypothetical protein
VSDVDLSEFEKLSKPTSGLCKVGVVLEAFEGEDREQLTAALAADSGRITNAAIMAWLKRRDVEGNAVSSPALTAHRNERCSCVR